MYTWDGLLVASAIPGTLSGNAAGWLDDAVSVTSPPSTTMARTTAMPRTTAYGRCIRYAFSSTGENFMTRSSGNFSWAAPPPANALPATNDRWAGSIPVTAPLPHQSPRQ